MTQRSHKKKFSANPENLIEIVNYFKEIGFSPVPAKPASEQPSFGLMRLQNFRNTAFAKNDGFCRGKRPECPYQLKFQACRPL
jgi:hypothetical protein